MVHDGIQTIRLCFILKGFKIVHPLKYLKSLMRFYKINLFALLFCISTALYSKNIISDYQRTYVPVYTKEGELAIALRVFNKNNIPSFLLVNTSNLNTTVMPIAEVSLSNGKNNFPQGGDYAQWQIAGTNYYQLLQRYTSGPYTLANYGITHARSGLKGNILTIDMCQSSVPFEKDFFDQLAKSGTKKPIPIAISISGLWLLMHKDEFHQLLDLQEKKQLAITWINHSFSHPYYDDLPYPDNFLLSVMINEDGEILLTEKYLLEENQIPSVFFRFPGLISNKKLIKKIKQFGLLPLGADAWIAKHQPITPGSIILVHGNGNEHEGITELMPKLKELELLPLNPNVT